MAMTENAKEFHEKMFPNYVSSFLETDPEFIEFFDNFAFDDVININEIDDKTKMMAICAVLIGSSSELEFKNMLPAFMNFDITPIMIKEIVYQSVAYLGIGRVLPFLNITNEVFKNMGIELPLEKQSTTNQSNRLQKGIEAQVDIFGESMREFYKSGDSDSVHINKWLTENCFGDYYTRNGLSYKERELITFCFLYAQGGAESQLASHTKANIRLGNDKDFLIGIISTCIPFIGYPRSLNALNIVKESK